MPGGKGTEENPSISQSGKRRNEGTRKRQKEPTETSRIGRHYKRGPEFSWEETVTSERKKSEISSREERERDKRSGIIALCATARRKDVRIQERRVKRIRVRSAEQLYIVKEGEHASSLR